MAVLATILAAAMATQAIRNADELSSAVYDRAEVGRPFAIDATIAFLTNIEEVDRVYFLRDATGAAIVETKNFTRPHPPIAPGDRVVASGAIELGPKTRLAYARCTNIAVVAHGPAPDPVPTTCAEIHAGKQDFQLVRFTAVLRSLVEDQIDVNFAYLVLGGDGATIPLALKRAECRRLFGNGDPGGSQVEVTGVCIAAPITDRRQFGRVVQPAGADALRILSAPSPNPFDAPALGDLRRMQPAQIAALGRRRVSGTVLAVEHRTTVIVRGDDGKIHDMQLAGGELPTSGARITAVGFPVSNMYRINLARAVWRLESDGEPVRDAGDLVTPRTILYNQHGERRIDARFHGRAIRLAGTVRGLGYMGEETSLKVECDRHLVEVDASACPEVIDSLAVGCMVEASGICVLETEIWSPDTVFPSISGFTLVLRNAADLHVTSRPPWWTTGRLVAAICVLLAAVLAVLVWNALLRRISERRGKELAAEQLASVESNLKVYERTRLAVELHDALSQTLAGVSFEIDAAERLAASDADAARRRLSSASRTLDSCRRELKNCLWDLRSNALEEPDMNAAIRRTLAPHIDGETLSVRFNVPRERFSEASAHAVLCIIRELVLNAIRHGAASHVWIAGNIERGTLRFSVRDNGTGFDVDAVRGTSDGHYGLLGIRERVDSFDGTFDLESSPGSGCKATVSMKAPGEDSLPDSRSGVQQ